MRVVGIAELPDELLLPEAERQPRIFLTPAFEQRFPNSVFYLNEWVRLRHGHADLSALRQAAARINRAAPDVDLPISPTGDGLVKVNQANDPLVNGLWILSALAALVGILLAGQSLGRTFAARERSCATTRHGRDAAAAIPARDDDPRRPSRSRQPSAPRSSDTCARRSRRSVPRVVRSPIPASRWTSG